MVLASALLRGLPHPVRPGFVNVTALIVLYFLPTIIAVIRRSTMTLWVVLIDLLAGWTVIGWIAALVLAIASQGPPRVTVTQGPLRPPAPPSSATPE